MSSRRRDGSDQSSDEVQRLEDDRGGAVPPRLLQEQLQPAVWQLVQTLLGQRRAHQIAAQTLQLLLVATVHAGGGLLRREGIYSSHLTAWRAQREQQGVEGLTPKRPGPKPHKDATDRMIEQRDKRIAKLEKQLRISKALIELQEKAHEILGIALPRIDDKGDSRHNHHPVCQPPSPASPT